MTPLIRQNDPAAQGWIRAWLPADTDPAVRPGTDPDRGRHL